MKVGQHHYRTIWLAADGCSVEIIDQRQLPHAFTTLRLTGLAEAAEAISTMAVRGAPLIGAAAAYGFALGMRADPSDDGIEAARATLSPRGRPPSTCAGQSTR